MPCRLYHANPMDAKIIGDLVEKYKGTFLLATPTFLANYPRKVTKEQFASLKYVLAGAEKVREQVAHAFEDAFGVRILEGYGCTEMAPVVAGEHTRLGRRRGRANRHRRLERSVIPYRALRRESASTPKPARSAKTIRRGLLVARSQPDARVPGAA